MRIVFALLFAAIVAAAQFAPSPATAQTIPQPVYLAVGDYLAAGRDATDGHGFVRMIADAMPNYALVADAPVGGIDNMIRQLPAVIAATNPALITIEVGSSDLATMYKPTFLRKYVKMLHLFRDNGYRNFYACTVPWTGQAIDSAEYARALEFNQVISSVTPALGGVAVDCWGATVGHTEYLSNGALNDAGHAVITNELLRAILHPVHFLPDVRR